MGILTYRCPNTSNEIRTAIHSDAKALAKLRHVKISVACPHCLGGHAIPADQLTVAPERV